MVSTDATLGVGSLLSDEKRYSFLLFLLWYHLTGVCSTWMQPGKGGLTSGLAFCLWGWDYNLFGDV